MQCNTVAAVDLQYQAYDTVTRLDGELVDLAKVPTPVSEEFLSGKSFSVGRFASARLSLFELHVRGSIEVSMACLCRMLHLSCFGQGPSCRAALLQEQQPCILMSGLLRS